MKQPDLFSITPNTTHVVVNAVYLGREYAVPVPKSLSDSKVSIKGYCCGYLKAAGVIRRGKQ